MAARSLSSPAASVRLPRNVAQAAADALRCAHQHLEALGRSVLQTLQRFGCDSRAPRRATFDDALLRMLTQLRSGGDDAPPQSRFVVAAGVDKRRLLIRRVFSDFGVDDSSAETLTETVMQTPVGKLSAARRESLTSTDPALRFIGRQLTMAFHGGVHLHRRLTSLMAEVTRPPSRNGPEATMSGLVELLGTFPDVATPVYRAAGFATLHSFPPQGGHKRLELDFAEAVRQEINAQSHADTVRLVGLVVAGVALTIITAGLAGPVVATLAGAGIGLVHGGALVAGASRDLQDARDGVRIGAMTSDRVRYHENELAGAWGALAVHVVTMGALARVGVGAPAFVRGVLIGAAGGGATAVVNPNVRESEDSLGLVLIGTVMGASGTALGAAAGGGARLLTGKRLLNGTKAQVGVPTRADGKPLQPGDRISVSLDRTSEPFDVELVRMSGDRIRFVIGEGSHVEVVVARAVQLTSKVPGAPTLVHGLASAGQRMHGLFRPGPSKISAVVIGAPETFLLKHAAPTIRLGAHRVKLSPKAGTYASSDAARVRFPDGTWAVAFRGSDNAGHLLSRRADSFVLARVDGGEVDPAVIHWIASIVRGTGPGRAVRTTVIDTPPAAGRVLARMRDLFGRTGVGFDNAARAFERDTGTYVGPLR